MSSMLISIMLGRGLDGRRGYFLSCKEVEDGGREGMKKSLEYSST